MYLHCIIFYFWLPHLRWKYFQKTDSMKGLLSHSYTCGLCLVGYLTYFLLNHNESTDLKPHAVHPMTCPPLTCLFLGVLRRIQGIIQTSVCISSCTCPGHETFPTVSCRWPLDTPCQSMTTITFKSGLPPLCEVTYGSQILTLVSFRFVLQIPMWSTSEPDLFEVWFWVVLDRLDRPLIAGRFWFRLWELRSVILGLRIVVSWDLHTFCYFWWCVPLFVVRY